MRTGVTAFAPGRVNLIGEHTDYNAGLALPFAIQAGVTVRAVAGSDPELRVTALDLEETDRFTLPDPSPASGWRAFVRGTAAELSTAGWQPPGGQLEIRGDVPQGSGLSSSAALEVALALALIGLVDDGPDLDRLELAKLCSRVENDWVGAQTGLLDQIASLCGETDQAIRIDFRTLDVRPVKLALGDFMLVTLDSGEQHVLAGSGYNQRRRECAQACQELGIESLREATLEMVERLPAPLAGRARHVVTENARVDATVDALERGDLAEVGRLLDASHASLRDDYDVSTNAVEDAVGRLKRAGALGARIMGGGFGGHVLGLMGPGSLPPEGATEVRPGPGARVVS